jgi:hypothetical protein
VPGSFQRERMTGRADGLRAGAEALGGFGGRVLDAGLFLVTRGAAIGRDGPHARRRGRVTFRAVDRLLDDVNAVPGHVASGRPRLVDVDTLSVGALLGRRRFLVLRAGGEHREHERCDEHPDGSGRAWLHVRAS